MDGLDGKMLNALAQLAEAETGQYLLPEAGYLYETRLRALLAAGGEETLKEFLAEALHRPVPRRNSEIAQALLDKDTGFFRDGAGLASLVSILKDRYAADRISKDQDKVRIWSAGCGSGQEAFTLALIAAGLPMFADNLERIDVLGTDVWRQGVAQAQSGCFSNHEMKEGLSARQLLSWFTRLNGGYWQASSALRRAVRFRPHNLALEPAPESGFDAIVCRNVLSGMTGRVRQFALSSLLDALSPGGLLLLGPDEHVGPILSNYHLIPQPTDGLFLVRHKDLSRKATEAPDGGGVKANIRDTTGSA